MDFLASNRKEVGLVGIILLGFFWHFGFPPAKAAVDVSPRSVSGSISALTRTFTPTIPAPTATSLPPTPTPPPTNTPAPTVEISEHFQRFKQQVLEGQENNLRGVHVEDVLALPVVQQPEEDPLFVDENMGTATQFQLANKKGVTGILAHNYLSGELFFNLKIGQEVHLVLGDGSTHSYRINEIQRYQKLTPGSNSSRYIDLSTQEELSTSEVFQRVYTGPDHVTFQTCIEKDGNWSWGLIFILARKI